MNIEIRKETPQDYHETELMTKRAFFNVYGPGCDEHVLVHKLREHEDYLPECSRIAVVDGQIAGTIMFMKAVIHGAKEDVTIASFGPLCVDHKYKNCGIGRKLLEETIPLVREAGFPGIVIFGEPFYYPKIGFKRGREFGLTDMEGNAWDAFMAYELVEGGLRIEGGRYEESSVVKELTPDALAELDKHFPEYKKVVRPCQWNYENASDDKNGYHHEYATHYPREFERLFRKYMSDDVEGVLEEIWGNMDKTPYVLFKGKNAFGIFVINNVNQPVIEHMYFQEECLDAARIREEISERFYRLNHVIQE